MDKVDKAYMDRLETVETMNNARIKLSLCNNAYLTMAGTSLARLLDSAMLNPISARPVCRSNGTNARVLP